MKKTIYLAILAIVTIFCIIIGSIVHLGLFRLGITEEITDKITDGVIIETSKETVDAMKNISEIDINCNIMNLNIESGKNFDISYSYSDERLKPVISTRDNTLTIRQASSGWKHRFGHHSDSSHLFNSSACKVTITVPEGTTLKDIGIQLNIGNAVLKEISAESCNITVNAGEIELEDFTSAFLEVSGNTGNMECKNCDIENAIIDFDIGEVTYQAKDPLSDCNITLVTDLGEVHAFGESHGRSFSKNGQHGSLKITTNIGSITVK